MPARAAIAAANRLAVLAPVPAAENREANPLEWLRGVEFLLEIKEMRERWYEEQQKGGKEGTRVLDCVPGRFQTYCKLLHPIYIDLSVQDASVTWDEWERAEGGMPLPNSIPPALATALRESLLSRGHPNHPFLGQRIF